MFKNLKAEMVRSGMSVSDMAKVAGISAKTLYKKLSGESDFTYSEIIAIRNYFGNLSFEYLFNNGADS